MPTLTPLLWNKLLAAVRASDAGEQFRRILGFFSTDQVDLEQLLRHRDAHADSLLHFVCRERNTDAVQILLDAIQLISEHSDHSSSSHNNNIKAAVLRASNQHGRQPLHEAAESAECTRLLLNFGHADGTLDVNCLKRGDWTPLHLAAMKGQHEVAKLLLEHGASESIMTSDGYTALHLAAQDGHLSVCELFAELGDNGDNQPTVDDGQTAISGNTGLFGKLMFSKTRSGRIPVHTAARGGHAPVVKWFIEEAKILGADSNTSEVVLKRVLTERDNSGASVIHSAAASGDIDTIGVICDASTSVVDMLQLLDDNGCTALHVACHGGNADAIKYIIDRFATATKNDADEEAEEREIAKYVNKKDTFDGWTSLHRAVISKSKSAVQALLKFNPDVSITDRHGRTAATLAKLIGREDLEQLITS